MFDDFADDALGDTPEVVPKCHRCKHFIREVCGTRETPPEPVECSHPTANASSTLPTFPFLNGCRHFEPKVWGGNRKEV